MERALNTVRMVVKGLCFLLITGALAVRGQSAPGTRTWTLMSGGEVYRLAEHHGAIAVDYFGPAALATNAGSGANDDLKREANNTGSREELFGQAEGESLSGSMMHLVDAQNTESDAGVHSIILTLQHDRLPLEAIVRYTSWADTGVFTREITLANTGDHSLSISSGLSLCLALPGGGYTVRKLYGSWSEEHQLSSQALNGAGWSYASTSGRSSNGLAPWISLRNEKLKTEYLAELAWSGNWNMQLQRDGDQVHFFGPLPNQGLRVSMGVHWDFGGPLRLPPGERYDLPKVAFTASSGDLDDISNQMHRYQRRFVFPQVRTNDPLLVQFNSWYPFPGNVQIDDMKRLANTASSLGAEVFVVDAGWYSHHDPNKELGDYQVNKAAFPHGLEELSDYVASKGMKFGLWVEIEAVGPEAKMRKEHSDWCLTYNGAPLIHSDRCHLDFAKPAVRAWATATIDRLVTGYQLSWLKIDYNLDVGDSFDPHGEGRRGDVLAQHIKHYYEWLDSLRKTHPDLVIENCASGALRMDTGILSHTHTNWLSDNVDPIQSLQLGYGCTIQFSPEVCNHWMVGDDDHGRVDLNKPAGWWDFMFRVPMNGQFGFSSHILEWSEPLKQHAAENIALYKRIRHVVAAADVYHLTPEPTHFDPTGWMALEYVPAAHEETVVTVYRLGSSPASKTFPLRGLKPEAKYDVFRDGQLVAQTEGREALHQGLEVTLDEEWRAAIYELREH